MKPDWKDAPEWANYLVMDEDGWWQWTEERPRRYLGTRWMSDGRYMYAPKTDWTKTLEKRTDAD